MPIQDGKYVAPTWNNNAPPPLNSSELQAICDTIAAIPNNYYTKNEVITAQTLQAYGFSADKLPNDAFLKLIQSINSINSQLTYNCRIYKTTYVGNGQFSVTIGGLRFLPQAIMISYASGNNWSSNLQGYRFFFAAGNINATENKVTFSSSRVTISVGQYSGADEWFPNENSWQYNFVAFG